MPKAAEDRLYKSVEQVIGLVNSGQPPTDALRKVAADNAHTAEEVRRIGEAFNVSRSLWHMKQASGAEKHAAVSLANADRAVAELFPPKPATPLQMAKTAGLAAYSPLRHVNYIDKLAAAEAMPQPEGMTKEAFLGLGKQRGFTKDYLAANSPEEQEAVVRAILDYKKRLPGQLTYDNAAKELYGRYGGEFEWALDSTKADMKRMREIVDRAVGARLAAEAINDLRGAASQLAREGYAFGTTIRDKRPPYADNHPSWSKKTEQTKEAAGNSKPLPRVNYTEALLKVKTEKELDAVLAAARKALAASPGSDPELESLVLALSKPSPGDGPQLPGQQNYSKALAGAKTQSERAAVDSRIAREGADAYAAEQGWDAMTRLIEQDESPFHDEHPSWSKQTKKASEMIPAHVQSMLNDREGERIKQASGQAVAELLDGILKTAADLQENFVTRPFHKVEQHVVGKYGRSPASDTMLEVLWHASGAEKRAQRRATAGELDMSRYTLVDLMPTPFASVESLVSKALAFQKASAEAQAYEARQPAIKAATVQEGRGGNFFRKLSKISLYGFDWTKNVVGGLKSWDPEGTYNRELGKAMVSLEDPETENRLKQIRVQAMLSDFLANDPVISSYDPSEVADFFNEIANLSPDVVDQPTIMRGMLRRALTQGQIEPFEAGALAGIGKQIADAKAPKRDLIEAMVKDPANLDPDKVSGPSAGKGGVLSQLTGVAMTAAKGIKDKANPMSKGNTPRGNTVADRIRIWEQKQRQGLEEKKFEYDKKYDEKQLKVDKKVSEGEAKARAAELGQRSAAHSRDWWQREAEQTGSAYPQGFTEPPLP
jgi:hypothetical protein